MSTAAPALRRLLLPLFFALACLVLSIFIWQSFGGAAPGGVSR